jgi:hypothetical protein
LVRRLVRIKWFSYLRALLLKKRTKKEKELGWLVGFKLVCCC